MTALSPLAATPLAALWSPVAAPPDPVILPGDLPEGEAVWLLRLGVAPSTGPRVAAPIGLMGGAPMAAADRPSDVPSTAPVVRASDRGWIGEPGDAAEPNMPYPARMIEPPALEYGVPVLPEGVRRRSFTAGEVLLANGDGALDYLAGNWHVGGQRVALLRGPHRRPRHAPLASFLPIATLRAGGAASGTTRLRLPLVDASADFGVPACNLYGGTGDQDGDARLAGQAKPRLYGIKRNFEPVLVDAARYIYQINDGAMQELFAVRDRGVPYTLATVRANYAALKANVPPAGSCDICYAEGFIRVEPATSTVSLLTVDARGDASGAGYLAGTPASIARKILTGPGGISSAAIAVGAFASWPAGEAGLYLRGGTVAAAMDELCAGIAAWWGADRYGNITGGQVEAPEGMAPSWAIQPWMLRAPPEEAEPPAPPRWRAVVGYQALGRVMSGEDLAGSVSAANRGLWGQPCQIAIEGDFALTGTYPQAVDPPVLVSVLDGAGDAGALALRLFDLHRVPRRTWRAQLNRSGLAIQPGQAVRLTWPRHGLSAGPVLIARSISVRGDRADVLLWG
jgi:hypothetical protein